MNISNREKQTALRNKPTTNKNLIATPNKNYNLWQVTPLINSLKNQSKFTQRLLLNLLRNNNTISPLAHVAKNTTINPAFTKLTNYLSDLKYNSKIVNNASVASQLIALNKDTGNKNTIVLGSSTNTVVSGELPLDLQNNTNKQVQENNDLIANLKAEGLSKSNLNFLNTSFGVANSNSKLTSPMDKLTLQLSNSSQLPQTGVSDLKTIKDLESEDALEKSLAELAISSEKSTKLTELRKKSFSKQFNLRKYLNLLSTFNSNIALNKNIIYNFNKTTTAAFGNIISHSPSPDGAAIGTANALKDNTLLSGQSISVATPYKNSLELQLASAQKQSALVQGRSQSNKILKNIYSILKNSFLSCYCLISKPILEVTPNKIVIKLFYYNFGKLPMIQNSLNLVASSLNTVNASPTKGNTVNNISSTSTLTWPDKNVLPNIIKDLEFLCKILSRLMKTSVVLDLVELKGYQLDGTILANSIGIITDKLGRNFRKTINKIFKKTIIINPTKMNNATYQQTGNVITGNKAIATYTGLNIRLAGRLSRQSVIPRKTVKIIQKGSLARRYNDFLTVSNFTAKNRRGIFCYTITIGHKYY